MDPSSDAPSGGRARLTAFREVLLLVVWECLLVFVAMLFSPPLGDANQAVGLPSSLLSKFPALSSMFFHSLALPLVAVVALLALSVFNTSGERRLLTRGTVTLGCLMASGAMAFILVEGESPLAHSVMVVGMGLLAAGSASLFLSLWPRREPSSRMNLLGFDLLQLTMWIVFASAFIAVGIGSYAAFGNGQWVNPPSLGPLPTLETIHESLIISFVDAAVVLLIAKWFRVEGYLGAPGTLARLGLCGILVGTPISLVSIFEVASSASASSGLLTVLGSIPMQASIFLMCAIAAGERRRLGVVGPLGIARESLTFGLVFLIYWIDIAVTLPSVYIDSHFVRFSSQYYSVYFLAAFATGHEHALVTLSAVLLFMLVTVMSGVRGKMGALAGLAFISGYILSTVANNFYIFSIVPNGADYVPYIGDGIALIVVGVLLSLGGMLFQWLARRAPFRSLHGEIKGTPTSSSRSLALGEDEGGL
ncbi:MAG TPA: hypothetical protein VMS77_07755 [Conexivisphaerales archaeon]|nr:hypothetical protein [Conexivisphaerales archaeon]